MKCIPYPFVPGGAARPRRTPLWISRSSEESRVDDLLRLVAEAKTTAQSRSLSARVMTNSLAPRADHSKPERSHSPKTGREHQVPDE